MMKEWNTWGDGSGVLQAVEDDHASFLSIHYFPEEFLKENRELIRKINLRLGYRFQLEGISWRDNTPVNGKFVVNWKWRNAGVAPCYMPAYPAVTLKDKKGGIVAVFVDANVRLDSLMPGKDGKGEDPFRFPNVCSTSTLQPTWRIRCLCICRRSSWQAVDRTSPRSR